MSRYRQPANRDAEKPLPHGRDRDKSQPYGKETEDYSGRGVTRPPAEKVEKRDGGKPTPGR